MSLAVRDAGGEGGDHARPSLRTIQGDGASNEHALFLHSPPPHAARRRRNPDGERWRYRCQRARDAGTGAAGGCRGGGLAGLSGAEPHLLRDRRPSLANRAAGRGARCGAGGGGRDARPAYRAARGCRPSPQRPAVQLRGGDRARRDPGRGAQDVSAELPRILRKALVQQRRGAERADHRDRRPGSAVRYRPDLCRQRPRALHLPCRDLRGLLVPYPALHGGCAGGGAGVLQPFRLQCRDRQVARARDVVGGTIGARGVRLCLFRRRAGRKHDRPCLGRARHDP